MSSAFETHHIIFPERRLRRDVVDQAFWIGIHRGKVERCIPG